MPRRTTEYAPIDQNTSFTQYLQEFEALSHNTPAAEAFLESVRNADAKFRELHARDSYGRVKMLTEEDRQQLINLHKEIGQKAEDLLLEENPPEYKTMVRKIAALASGNYNSLRNYSPEEPKTLPEILEDVRTIKLDLRGASLKGTLGAKQSSRQPLTFLNENGETVTGVFTPIKRLNIVERFKKDLQALSGRPGTSPDAARILSSFSDKIQQNFSRLVQDRNGNPIPPSTDPEENLNDVFSLITDKDGNYDESKLEFALDEVFSDEYPEDNPASMKLKKSEIREIKKLFDKYGIELGVNNYSAGIRGGSRIDNRNAAMSTVAELLGVPDLVARSRPMKVIDKNGNEVEGTFMTEAKGLDTGNLSIDAINVGSQSLKNTDGNALKSIADLQVLDFVCGNVDRHGGNIFYQFDGLARLTGIQGIDNDSSFGTYFPKNGRNRNRLVGFDNMMTISQSMAQKLLKLRGPELRFALRGYGLSEEELDAAAKRLNALKNKIVDDNEYFRDRLARIARGEKVTPPGNFVPGRIRIIPDTDFKYVSFKELSRVDPKMRPAHRNLFAIVAGNVRAMANLFEKQKKEYESLRSAVAIGEDNRANPANLKTGEATSAGLLREMKTRTIEGWWKWHHGTSAKFEKMRAAVKAYNDYQKELIDRLGIANHPDMKKDPDQVLRSFIGVNDLAKLSALGKKVKMTADAYLQDKEGRNNNSYTQSRMEIAELARTFGEKAMERKPEEMELARKNQNRAEQRYNHLMADMDIRFQNSPELQDDPSNRVSGSPAFSNNKEDGPIIQA